MGTEVTVVLRSRGYADLVDAKTGEVIVKGRPVAEIQKRADRVNAIWARRMEEEIPTERGTVTLSEGARKMRDSMVGTWAQDSDRYAVFVSVKGGLAAVSLRDGSPVGAGLPITGHWVGPLPEGFQPPADA